MSWSKHPLTFILDAPPPQPHHHAPVCQPHAPLVPHAPPHSPRHSLKSKPVCPQILSIGVRQHLHLQLMLLLHVMMIDNTCLVSRFEKEEEREEKEGGGDGSCDQHTVEGLNFD
jgi:hypothetical protein